MTNKEYGIKSYLFQSNLVSVDFVDSINLGNHDCVWTNAHYSAILTMQICMNLMSIASLDPSTAHKVGESCETWPRDMSQSDI